MGSSPSTRSGVLGVSSDGAKLYVPSFSPDGYEAIAELDSTTFQILRSVSPVYGSNMVFDTFTLASSANSIYVLEYTPSSLSSFTQARIDRVDLGTFTVVASRTVNFQPWDAAVTPDDNEYI